VQRHDTFGGIQRLHQQVAFIQDAEREIVLGVEPFPVYSLRLTCVETVIVLLQWSALARVHRSILLPIKPYMNKTDRNEQTLPLR
jgi:hypothetical protein